MIRASQASGIYASFGKSSWPGFNSRLAYMVKVVSLQPSEVMFVRAASPKTSATAFNKLESKLPPLKSRRFYGLVYENEYRACVNLLPGDTPEALGFETMELPSGEYAQAKILNWTQNLDKIGLSFEQMKREFKKDMSRPSIEFYRSQNELGLLMPIKKAKKYQ